MELFEEATQAIARITNLSHAHARTTAIELNDEQRAEIHAAAETARTAIAAVIGRTPPPSSLPPAA